jgi:hypothetical protein
MYTRRSQEAVRMVHKAQNQHPTAVLPGRNA